MHILILILVFPHYISKCDKICCKKKLIECYFGLREEINVYDNARNTIKLLSITELNTYTQCFVGLSINFRTLVSSKTQIEDLEVSVTSPPLTNAPEMATSLTFGIAVVTVTPSEHTGLEGSSALL